MGFDLVDVDEIAASIGLHGVRYLERVYSGRELAECRGTDGEPDPRALAACFAAKEATLKVLGVGEAAVPWRAIEMTRARGERPMLTLSGAAAALAAQHGIGELSLSLARSGALVSAVVLAGTPPTRQQREPPGSLPRRS